MGSFVENVSKNLFKILVTLVGLAIVFYALTMFRIWSLEWTEYFLKRAKLEEYIFISLIVAAISIVVLKLFGWHLRMQAGGR